jgi:hypothetical protein
MYRIYGIGLGSKFDGAALWLDHCCTQQSGMHRMDASNCLVVLSYPDVTSARQTQAPPGNSRQPKCGLTHNNHKPASLYSPLNLRLPDFPIPRGWLLPSA